jgi:hypothetical protein
MKIRTLDSRRRLKFSKRDRRKYDRLDMTYVRRCVIDVQRAKEKRGETAPAGYEAIGACPCGTLCFFVYRLK